MDNDFLSLKESVMAGVVIVIIFLIASLLQTLEMHSY